MIGLYFLLAFVLSSFLHRANPYLTDDGTNYLRIAQNLFAGQGISINPGKVFLLNPPFYSIPVALFDKFFFGNVELAGAFVSILSFSLTLFPLFYLSRSLYGPRAAQQSPQGAAQQSPQGAAHWTCLLYLTNGFLLVYSHLALSEPLFTLLLMTFIYHSHRALQEDRPPLLRGILLGLFGGMAYLTRPEGFLFFVVGILVILFFSSARLSSRFRLLISALVVFFIFLSPYLYWTYQNTGHWQLSGGVLPELIRRTIDISHPDKYLEVKKIIEGLSMDKTRLKIDELVEQFHLRTFFVSSGFAALLRSIPLALMSRVIEFNRYFYAGIGFFFTGAGFVAEPWDERRRRSQLLLFALLLPFLFHLFIVFDARRYLPIYPIFLLWMGNGMETFRNWSKKSFRFGPKRSFALVLGVWTILTAFSFGYVSRYFTATTFPFEHREMGLWMKENIPHIREETVVTHRPFAAFYSGGGYAWLPYVDRFEDLLIYMRSLEAKYFVVAEDLDTPVLDSYRFLLDETKDPPPGISRVHVVRGAHKVILYRISG